MKNILLGYRVMAAIVGVLLIILVLIGLPLHWMHLINPAWFPKGSAGEQLGANISSYLGVAHGWLYMIFLFVAFWLSRRADWEIPYTIVTLVAGTVPILSFWAERRAVARVRAEFPDLDAPTTATEA